MKVPKILLLLFALAAPPVWAQNNPQNLSTNGACAQIDVTGLVTVGIQVTGTWTATLQPEVSISGQAPANTQVTPSTSSTAQSTISANGLYYANVSGANTFFICVTAYTSGTASIWLQGSKTLSRLTGGGGGGGGGTPGGSNTQVQYNNGGAFGGTAGLTWNSGNGALATAQTNTLGPASGDYAAVTSTVTVQPSAGQSAGQKSIGYSAIVNANSANEVYETNAVQTHTSNIGSGLVDILVGVDIFGATNSGGGTVGTNYGEVIEAENDVSASGNNIALDIRDQTHGAHDYSMFLEGGQVLSRGGITVAPVNNQAAGAAGTYGLNVSGETGGAAASVTSNGNGGAPITLISGAGSAGGATSGTGGNGGLITITAGNGGSATSGSTTGGGGNIQLTPGANGGVSTTLGNPGKVLIQGTTVNSSYTTPTLDVTATWNTTGQVDALIRGNVSTNTASGANSRLIDLQLASTSEFFVDKNGQAEAAAHTSFGTTFTSNNGCTESSLTGGASAGKFTVGQNTACTIILTMGNSVTAPHGWSCWAYDQTAVPAVAIRQTASTTTTASLLMTVATNDVISFGCEGY